MHTAPVFQQECAMKIVAGIVLAISLGLASPGASAQDKVVYHIADTAAQALGGLRNVKNHIDTDPGAQITVVTHAQGVDFLMLDAKDRNGNAYEAAIQELARRGVKFEVCEITLKNRGLKKEQFIEEAKFTPSGVVRLAKLQKEGYAYIRP
jgi:intracellular sulfur oxidation DsrE/DsrF family protein